MNTFTNFVKEHEDEQEIYTKVVRAGKRTYFFDVKATKGDDYYLTITESRKKLGPNGEANYEKHKMYLYKEDFVKFAEGLNETINYIKKAKPEFFESESNQQTTANEYTLSVDDEFDI